jgi:hypothetical protein
MSQYVITFYRNYILQVYDRYMKLHGFCWYAAAHLYLTVHSLSCIV